MELLLNALWLIVTFVVVALACAISDVQAAPGRHRRIRTFLAAGCVALLLFPLISVSDDLNGERVAVREAWTAIKKASSLTTATARAGPGPMLPASLPTHRPYWHAVFAVTNETLVIPYSGVPRQLSGRAPPAWFL